MIILSDKDKENIFMMPKEAHKYCSYPDVGFIKKDIKVFMNVEKGKVDLKVTKELLDRTKNLLENNKEIKVTNEFNKEKNNIKLR